MLRMKAVFILASCEHDFSKRKNLLAHVGFSFLSKCIIDKKTMRVNKILANVVLFLGKSVNIKVLYYFSIMISQLQILEVFFIVSHVV